MSLTDVLPNVQSLSRSDKIDLLRFLTTDLESDPGELIEKGRPYDIWSPDRAFDAAAALLAKLHEEKKGSS